MFGLQINLPTLQKPVHRFSVPPPAQCETPLHTQKSLLDKIIFPESRVEESPGTANSKDIRYFAVSRTRHCDVSIECAQQRSTVKCRLTHCKLKVLGVRCRTRHGGGATCVNGLVDHIEACLSAVSVRTCWSIESF